MSRTTRRSHAMLDERIGHPWSSVSKNARMSASSTQFTFFVMMADGPLWVWDSLCSGVFPLVLPFPPPRPPPVPGRCSREFAVSVGGGAPLSAGLRPPLKLHVRFSACSFHEGAASPPRGQRRDQVDQTHQPSSPAEAPCREGLPARTAPPSIAVRPHTSRHPTDRVG